MAEITLRDLCRWDRRLALTPPSGMTMSAALDLPVSWAVSVRANVPLLPPLRGDELVVLPLRVLEQIDAAETLSGPELLESLAPQGIAAILTEPGFIEHPFDALPILTLPSPFPPDAETTFNRLLTERRAELYRLGNELSRRLSHAALDPGGIESLLAIAAEMSGRAVVLQDAEGNVVAWGGREMIPPAWIDTLEQVRNSIGPQIYSEESAFGYRQERLIATLAAGGQSGYLSMIGDEGTITEVDRLVLNQTAATCSIMLGQRGNLLAGRAGREQQVADLLLGRLASEAALMSRARSLGLEPTAPLVVGLIGPGADSSLARELLSSSLESPENLLIAPIPSGVAFILQAPLRDQFQSNLTQACQRVRGGATRIALSAQVDGVKRIPEGLRQVQFLLDLALRGSLQQQVLVFDDIHGTGIYQLLYYLWGHPMLESFQQQMLAELEEYDARRDSLLIETLDAYLSSGAAHAETADRLAIHRNTLSYRLRRIQELTGHDLADPEQRTLLWIALRCRTLPSITSA